MKKSPKLTSAISYLILNYSIIKQPTCYKSSRGKCIDLILTNKNMSFQKSNSFETGISDHHHLIYINYVYFANYVKPTLNKKRTKKTYIYVLK